jgi:hypothetical protein
MSHTALAANNIMFLVDLLKFQRNNPRMPVAWIAVANHSVLLSMPLAIQDPSVAFS